MRQETEIIEYKSYGIAVHYKELGFGQDLVFNHRLLTSLGFLMLSRPRDYNSICAYEGKVYVIMKALDLLDMMESKREDIRANEFGEWLYEDIINSFAVEGKTQSSEILFMDMLYALHQWEMSSGLGGDVLKRSFVV